MSDRVFGIAQLNQYIRSVFDAEELLHNIRIGGEISGFALGAKNVYFTLKDDEAQIGCVCFAYAGSQIFDGDRVVLTGTPTYYAKGGRLNFVVTKIEKAGLGELYRQFLELKNKLAKEGLFDRKIEMPASIRRIGVITSPNGAVIHDIANVARRRDPSVDIVLYPVRVQGIGAAEEIVGALKRLDGYAKIDAIILARGGGSAEDLSVYDDESVARAVAACQKFIVSAVGHETDNSLCDECADLRAPTPSAAAELLTVDRNLIRRELQEKTIRLFNALYATYSIAERRLNRTAGELKYASSQAISAAKHSASVKAMRLSHAAQGQYNRREAETRRALDRLEYRNPLTVLKNGYVRIFAPDPVQSVDEIRIGQNVRVRMSDGNFYASVTEIRKEQS